MEETIMKKFIISLSIALFVGTGALAFAGCEVHDAGFKHYTAAQEALAADNFAGAQKALQALAKTCTVDCEDGCKPFVKAAANAMDIAKMRLAFKKVSDIIASHGAPEGYDVAYCPMADNNKGAYWVQKKGDIANPYFGASMLRCGKFKKYEGGKKHSHMHKHGQKHEHKH
jgi:Cu(I)/Ag(I) efflux system membrane fusion protein